MADGISIPLFDEVRPAVLQLAEEDAPNNWAAFTLSTTGTLRFLSLGRGGIAEATNALSPESVYFLYFFVQADLLSSFSRSSLGDAPRNTLVLLACVHGTASSIPHSLSLRCLYTPMLANLLPGIVATVYTDSIDGVSDILSDFPQRLQQTATFQALVQPSNGYFSLYSRQERRTIARFNTLMSVWRQHKSTGPPGDARTLIANLDKIDQLIMDKLVDRPQVLASGPKRRSIHRPESFDASAAPGATTDASARPANTRTMRYTLNRRSPSPLAVSAKDPQNQPAKVISPRDHAITQQFLPQARSPAVAKQVQEVAEQKPKRQRRPRRKLNVRTADEPVRRRPEQSHLSCDSSFSDINIEMNGNLRELLASLEVNRSSSVMAHGDAALKQNVPLSSASAENFGDNPKRRLSNMVSDLPASKLATSKLSSQPIPDAADKSSVGERTIDEIVFRLGELSSRRRLDRRLKNSLTHLSEKCGALRGFQSTGTGARLDAAVTAVREGLARSTMAFVVSTASERGVVQSNLNDTIIGIERFLPSDSAKTLKELIYNKSSATNMQTVLGVVQKWVDFLESLA